MKYINLKLHIFSKLYILLLICQLSHSFPYRLTLKTPSSKNSNSNKDSITVTSEDIKNSVRNIFFGKDGHSPVFQHPYYNNQKNREKLVFDMTNALLKSYLMDDNGDNRKLVNVTGKQQYYNQVLPRSFLQIGKSQFNDDNMDNIILSPHLPSINSEDDSLVKNFRLKRIASETKTRLRNRMRTRMYSGDPLGLDTMAKGIKTTLNGLNGELSPKALGLPPITQIASLNLEGCWDAIKGNILTGCGANTAKAAVKAIMKKSISGGRGVSVDQAGEHGASDIDIHGMVSSAAECIFKDACTGAS